MFSRRLATTLRPSQVASAGATAAHRASSSAASSAASVERPSLGRWVAFIGAALVSSEIVSRRLRDTSVESMAMLADANSIPLWHGDDCAPPSPPSSPSGGLAQIMSRVHPGALVGGHNKPQ